VSNSVAASVFCAASWTKPPYQCSKPRTASWQLIEVKRPYLVEQLCWAAQFQRYNKRAKKFVPIDAPDKVAEAYLNRQGHWKLPHLIGVVNAPFVRVDGSICETAGYDPDSYVLFKPETQIFPPVPQYPSKADAVVALGKLRKLIETFPFKTAADHSVALAAMLTVLHRRSMATAPLIGFSAPMARTGKSLLVKLMGILATGRAVPTKSQGKNEEEFEKRLGGNLLAGDVCISIDNCSRPLTGDMLCQALSEDEVEVRVLGFTHNIKTATIATIFATGNNLIIADDLTDRCLLCSLDAKVERPGSRKFSVDVVKETRARRGELVVAVLTILRAWHIARAAGERVNNIDPFGGFDDWSRQVREALIWLGQADPNDTMNKAKENDPAHEELVAVLLQWEKHIGIGSPYTVQEVIAYAVNTPTFYTALMNVAASKSGAMVSNDRLGRWLKQVEGKICNGLRLVRVGNQHGYPTWSLKQ
jgi:putative DNA primase/helicase